MTGHDPDPRLVGDQVRSVAGPSGTVTLVGVVHDHPASTYRASQVVRDRDPDVLALELAPLALPLFERYALDDRTSPDRGGEMSAAIRAAADARVVGIDGPTCGFLYRLIGNLRRERASPATVRTVAAGVASATREAAACRAASLIAALTPFRPEVGSSVDHECSRDDDPARQAEDERGQIQRARAIMDALEPARAVQFRDATREAHMADRLAALRREGDVVAVVGSGHLEPLIDRLSDN